MHATCRDQPSHSEVLRFHTVSALSDDDLATTVDITSIGLGQQIVGFFLSYFS